MTLEPISVPYRQLAVVLCGFPVAYVLNDFNPWSKQLVLEGDRSRYVHYWSTIGALHWGSVAVIAAILATNGYGPADVGLAVPEHPAVLWLSVVIGAVTLGWYGIGVLARDPIPTGALAMPFPGMVTPRNLPERLFQLLCGGVTAGVCEEVVYRGFAVLALLGVGIPWWGAIPLASLAFVFVHGLAPLYSPKMFGSYYVLGVVGGCVFLASGTLLLPIALHLGYNLVSFVRTTDAVLEQTSAPQVAR